MSPAEATASSFAGAPAAPVPATPPHAHGHRESQPKLLSPLLVWAVVFCDIGTSVYYVPGILYGQVGPLAPLFVLGTTAGFLLLAAKYVEICWRNPEGGGVVTVATKAFNPRWGCFGGMLITVDYFLTSAISSVSGMNYLASLFASLDAHIIGLSVAALVFLAAINLIGIRESAIISLFMAIAALAVDVLVVGVTCWNIGPPHWNLILHHLTLGSTFLFDELPSFRETLTLPDPERMRRLRDPALRARMRRELADPTGRAFVFVWDVVRVEAVRDAEHRAWIGRTVPDLAAERGQDPLDCFLDCSLAEDLETQFGLEMPPSDYFRECTARLLRDPIVMAGSSDGGAHLLSFTGADYPTRLLSEWVPDVLTLEEAVRKLTAVPAAVHGLADRGAVREGAWADLVVVDFSRLRAGAPRLVHDFPGGSGRFVVDADGYVAVVVNGEVLLESGRWTGALPGQVVRAG